MVPNAVRDDGHYLKSLAFKLHQATLRSPAMEVCLLTDNRVPPYIRSHTTKNKIKLLARVRRLKGQIEAMERSLEANASCGEVLNLAASVRGAVSGLTAELIEDHIREHVSNPDKDDNAARAQGAAELIEVVRAYLK